MECPGSRGEAVLSAEAMMQPAVFAVLWEVHDTPLSHGTSAV